MSMGYGADYATASDILVRGNSIFAATDYGLYECKLPNATISEIEGEGMDMPLIAGVAAESVKMVKTSDESGLEIRSVQNSIPVGKGFIDYTIEIPMDGSYAITLMSAAGTEIPIVGAMDLTTGKYNLQVYNSSYQGVCYLKVEGNSDYHIVASLVR